MRYVPTPEEYQAMSWHARQRLRLHLKHTPPEPDTSGPTTSHVLPDLHTIIGLLDAALTDHFNRNRKKAHHA